MLDPIDRTTERELREQIDASNMEEHLEAFDGLERFSGTEDEREASEYVVETLEEYGVEAELLEHETYISRPENARVEVRSPSPRTIDDAITTVFGASTPSSGVHGEVEYVEDPTALEEGEMAGKIAFTTGLPGSDMVTAAERAGAVALIVESLSEGRLHDMTVSPIWGTPSADNANQLPELPVAEIGRSDAQWLRDQIEQEPTEATVVTDVTTEVATLPFPVGRIEGAESDRYLVVGNHVDSWYEGLTDNATAMAATLEIARIFADREPKRGLVFGFWSAHSFGRFAGSAWYADAHWNDLRDNGVLYLHLDLNGLEGADALWYEHMAEVEDEHLDIMRSATGRSPEESDDDGDVPLWEDSDRPGRSADQSFWGAGLSSMFSGIRLPAGTEAGGPVGGGWWWHTPEDTIDKVDPDVLAEETGIYVTIASRICNSPVLPHDYTRTVADIRETLDEIVEAADGQVSFDDLERSLTALEDAVETANGIIDERAANDPELARAAEDLQVTLGNELIPTLYMDNKDYEHEPAGSHQLLPSLRIAEDLPSLAGRSRVFAETKLRRGRNRLRHRVDRARTAVNEFVESS